MKRHHPAWIALGALLLTAAGSGCGPLGTFNMYHRISVLDYSVAPHKQGRVAPESLQNVKEAAVRWLRSRNLFMEVDESGSGGGPDTLFVQGVVTGYRGHSHGRTALNVFTGVDVRGLAIIDYRFFDATGRTILTRRVQSRYRYPAPNGDPTAEAAGYDLANFVAWHKSVRPGYR